MGMFMHFTEIQAREAIRLYPHIASEMKLSKQALDAYYFIKGRSGGATVSDISTIWRISLQHANQILKPLVKKGYCTRHQKPQTSGGHEFIYVAVRSVNENEDLLK